MALVRNTIKFSSGGGGSDITVVANYSALPDPTTVSGQFYWCSASQGTSWLPGSLGGTYYNSGLYYSNGTSWEFLNVPFNATQSEVNTGTNNDKFVTPSTLSNSNWAFTTAKVLSTALTGLSLATGGTIVSTDSVLVAFGKIQKQIDALLSTGSRLITTGEITKLTNTSGTNSGDNATNTTSNAYADAKVEDNLTASTSVAPSKTAINTALELKSDKADVFTKSLNGDISLTSSTQLDTNLSFPIGANEVWMVWLDLLGGCTSSGGIRATIKSPTGSSGNGGLFGTNNTVFTPQTFSVNSLTTAFGQGNSNSTQRMFIVIRNGATSGNVTLSFASSSAGQSSVIRGNSTICAMKTILI